MSSEIRRSKMSLVLLGLSCVLFASCKLKSGGASKTKGVSAPELCPGSRLSDLKKMQENPLPDLICNQPQNREDKTAADEYLKCVESNRIKRGDEIIRIGTLIAECRLSIREACHRVSSTIDWIGDDVPICECEDGPKVSQESDGSFKCPSTNKPEANDRAKSDPRELQVRTDCEAGKQKAGTDCCKLGIARWKYGSDEVCRNYGLCSADEYLSYNDTCHPKSLIKGAGSQTSCPVGQVLSSAGTCTTQSDATSYAQNYNACEIAGGIFYTDHTCRSKTNPSVKIPLD